MEQIRRKPKINPISQILASASSRRPQVNYGNTIHDRLFQHVTEAQLLTKQNEQKDKKRKEKEALRA